MKKIINGKKYDTETAKMVGTYWNGYSTSDFHWREEHLYRKNTGEFFLYGEGGAMTKYSCSCGDSVCGGDAILPLSEAEAREWAEEHMDGDEYEAVFGTVEE